VSYEEVNGVSLRVINIGDSVGDGADAVDGVGWSLQPAGQRSPPRSTRVRTWFLRDQARARRLTQTSATMAVAAVVVGSSLAASL